jgi:hypothetical protein
MSWWKRSYYVKRWVCGAVAIWMLTSAAAGAQTLKGTSALQGEVAQTDGFLKVTPGAGPMQQRLDFWMTLPGSAAPILQYQAEMTQKLHVVVVSDDFRTFLHIHPQLLATGHFAIAQTFPAAGRYHVYADGEPNALSHQVFRFDLVVGKAGGVVERKLQATGMGVKVGPYEVDLSSVRLHAGRTEMIDVEILKGGKLATDLHPYLGVPAHAVFLNDKDLTYVHVHPMAVGGSMDMSRPVATLPDNASSSGEMMLHVAIKEAGTYKLWLQFRGAGDQLYIAEFTLNAS